MFRTVSLPFLTKIEESARFFCLALRVNYFNNGPAMSIMDIAGLFVVP